MIFPCTREQFTAVPRGPLDGFARTFVAKADMIDGWNNCYGYWNEREELCGAVLVTCTKRLPYVANLQLLHTFGEHRGKGIGNYLCNDAFQAAKGFGASHLRVSSEIESINFYRKIGVKFQGRQKSGCLLSISNITKAANWPLSQFSPLDDVMRAAVYKKGKGGCVEVFDEPY